MTKAKGQPAASVEQASQQLKAEGKAVIWVSKQQQILGLIAVAD
ncbi:MAG: hypothetical protein WBA76_02095 [Phormidesmis sp.]